MLSGNCLMGCRFSMGSDAIKKLKQLWSILVSARGSYGKQESYGVCWPTDNIRVYDAICTRCGKRHTKGDIKPSMKIGMEIDIAPCKKCSSKRSFLRANREFAS